MPNSCRSPLWPLTPAEAWASQQCTVLDSLFARPAEPFSRVPFGEACNAIDTLYAFDTTFSGAFELDEPLREAWLRQLAVTEPDAVVRLLALSEAPGLIAPAKATQPGGAPDGASGTALGGAPGQAALQQFLQELQSASTDAGNLAGHAHATLEASLREAWRRQALTGFQSLLSGQAPSIRVGRHILVEARKIGRDGLLRAGARLQVRITQLPMAVIQQLPSPVVLKSRGTVGALRVGARDVAGLQSAAQTIAHARVQSSQLLRSLSSKAGSGVLAFGPSAAIDFYNSARWTHGGLEVNWKGFAVASAKSQTGNFAGLAGGLLAGGAAVGLAGISAVGAPVILIGLAGGIVAQAVWGWLGADEAAARAVERQLR